jgi:glycosyltransferase involved in cell wall biosynthesis
VRIVYITSSLGTGGAEIMLYQLLDKMRCENFEPFVISLMDKGSLGEKIETSGVPVHTLGMRSGRPTIKGLVRLYRILVNVRPDLIQGWMYHGNLAATIGAALLHTHPPVVWSIHHSLHSIGAERPLTRAVIRLSALLSGQPALVLFVSRLSVGQHQRFGFDTRRHRVIPNGFDCDAFRPDPSARKMIRKELNVEERHVLIGLLARYHPMKDHRNFLEAAARLAALRPEVRFMLAGTGVDTDNSELIQLITAHGISDRVDLLGERKDVSALLSALDILCCSSFGEAFPLIVGEAMASGVPCVVTDVGDTAWLVGETGRVVPPKDPEALAAGLSDLVELGEEGRQMLGNRARQRILANFSIDGIVSEYRSVYDALVAR